MEVSAAALGIAIVIALDCAMTFFGSSANDAAYNAWLTDSTDRTNRGAAEGINAMMPLVAILVVFGGFMFFDLQQAQSWRWIFAIIGAVVTLVGVLGFFLIEEPKGVQRSESGYWRNVTYGFLPSTARKNPSLYLYFFLFVLFNISIQIFMPYLILYYDVTLQLDNYVLIMAPAVILASVFTAVYGRVYDRVGFVRALLPAMGMLCAGYVILFATTNVALVFVGSLLMMSGYLSGSAVFGAMIRDCTPRGKAGMFQGLRIFGQVLIPGVVGPAVGAAVLKNAETVLNDDGTTSFVPNNAIFLAALIAAVVLLPLIPLLKKEKTQ